MTHAALKNINEGGLKVEGYEKELQKIQFDIRQSNRRTIRAIVGSAMMVCAAVTSTLTIPAVMTLAGISLISWVSAGAGVLLLASIWNLRHDS